MCIRDSSNSFVRKTIGNKTIKKVGNDNYYKKDCTFLNCTPNFMTTRAWEWEVWNMRECPLVVSYYRSTEGTRIQ